MRQLLKKYARKLLPGRVIGHLKDRSERIFLTPSPKYKCVLEPREDGILCRIDGSRSFVALEICRGDLEYYTTPRGQTEFSALVEAAEQAEVAFDIGAHAGLVSAILCAANPRLRVFSFEPSPPLCQRLEATVALNNFGDRMSIQRVGIGAEAQTMEMLIDPAGGFVQTQRFDHTMWGQPETIQVPLETIEGAADRLAVVPSLVKVDIEGYEYEAIQGSLAFLKRHRPKILLELHLNYLEQRQHSARALLAMLSDVGYALKAYSGRELRPAQVYQSPMSTVHVMLR